MRLKCVLLLHLRFYVIQFYFSIMRRCTIIAGAFLSPPYVFFYVNVCCSISAPTPTFHDLVYTLTELCVPLFVLWFGFVFFLGGCPPKPKGRALSSPHTSSLRWSLGCGERGLYFTPLLSLQTAGDGGGRQTVVRIFFIPRSRPIETIETIFTT